VSRVYAENSTAKRSSAALIADAILCRNVSACIVRPSSPSRFNPLKFVEMALNVLEECVTDLRIIFDRDSFYSRSYHLCPIVIELRIYISR